jgi:hypothetical protein
VLVARLIVLLFAALPAAAQEVVAVLPATGVNVPDNELVAAQELFRGHLESTRSYKVVLVRGAPQQSDPTPQEAVEAAKKAGGTLAAAVRVVRLGTNSRVRLTVYRVPSGEQAHFDELPAASANDLDPALERLARGYAQGSTARAAVDIETVTEREEQPLRKIKATKGFGLRFGGVWAMQQPPGAKRETAPGGGIFWFHDARNMLVDISIDAYRRGEFFQHSDLRLFHIGLGAYYPFTKGNLAPYAGGGVGYAWTKLGGKGDDGLLLRASGGFIWGRVSNIQVRGELSWFTTTYREPPSGAGESRHANGLIFSLGASFSR